MNTPYDLSHPVAVWSLWNIEKPPSTRDVMQIEVTDPRFQLWTYAKTGPTSVTCFHDMDCQQNESDYDVDHVALYAVDHRKAVIQLVTLMNKRAAEQRLQLSIFFCRQHEDFASLYRLNQKDVAFGFMCDRFMGHTLGMRAECFDESVIEEGMQRTLKQLCFPLADLTLRWLTRVQSDNLLEEIHTQMIGES